MPETTTPQGAAMPKARYIVRAREEGPALTALSDLLGTLGSMPGAELIDTIGPAGRVHTAVIAATPEQALLLEQRVRNSHYLMIEPDRPLSLYD